jgi:hypothetical protein
MMLYNKNQPQNSRKAVFKGCLSLIILGGIMYVLPYIGIWVINTLRKTGGQESLPYTINNWAVSLLFILTIFIIVSMRRKRK